MSHQQRSVAHMEMIRIFADIIHIIELVVEWMVG
jgi:hypothetical protein